MNKTAIKAKLVRQACKAILGGPPPEDPFASWFGRVRVGHRTEPWPTFGGKPMMGLCQIKVAELPFVPDRLADIALITVFIRQDDIPDDNSRNGEQWLLRAYPAIDGLSVVEEPKVHGIKPMPIKWELVKEDYPTWDEASGMDVPEEIADDYDDDFENVAATKVGGWPSTIQGELSWGSMTQSAEPEFLFQFNSEEKAQWQWADAGCAYFGRGTGGASAVWTFTWQNY